MVIVGFAGAVGAGVVVVRAPGGRGSTCANPWAGRTRKTVVTRNRRMVGAITSAFSVKTTSSPPVDRIKITGGIPAARCSRYAIAPDNTRQRRIRELQRTDRDREIRGAAIRQYQPLLFEGAMRRLSVGDGAAATPPRQRGTLR